MPSGVSTSRGAGPGAPLRQRAVKDERPNDGDEEGPERDPADIQRREQRRDIQG